MAAVIRVPVPVLVLVGLVSGAAPAVAQVIPPGQERVVAAMLGRGIALPDGCRLADGQVERALVRATYRCPSGDVVVELSHRAPADGRAIRTAQFALSVVTGTPPEHLVGALEALVRANEPDFEWTIAGVAKHGNGVGATILRVPPRVFGLLLLLLGLVAAISGRRAWPARRRLARGAALEAAIVAVVVVVWLQANVDPPAHTDTAIDVALARDCIASRGASCLGHASSAMALLQGQSFTYALAVWLALGLSMRALSFVAASVNGAAVGLLHYVTSRRFGGVAWIVSAAIADLGVQMTGYPNIWNPSWFLLPMAAAFVATLATAEGAGIWSAFAAGLGLALATEAHEIFGVFVAVVVAIAVATARRGVVAGLVVLASFLLIELVVSPLSLSVDVGIVADWLVIHRVAAVALAVSSISAVPVLWWLRGRLTVHPPEVRERFAAAAWLGAGLAIGVVLPWAASRPVQIRYYGAAFPAIAYAGSWLLDAATLRARSIAVRAVSIVAFAAIFAVRIVNANFGGGTWFMDDGSRLAPVVSLPADALDIQLAVRTIPGGALDQVTAAFAGAPGLPEFPPRIVRAVRPQDGVGLPAGWTRVPGAHGGMFVGDIDAWAHPEEAEVCPDPPSGEVCTRVTRDDFTRVAEEAGDAVHRVFGLRLFRISTEVGKWAQQGAHAVVWRIPVRAVGADDAREVVVWDEPGERIVGVEGTGWTAWSGTRATIRRPPPHATAWIAVRTPIAGKYEAGVPPLPVELREDEAAALRAMLSS